MTTMIEATLGVALMTMALANSNMQAVRTNERTTAIQTGQYMSGIQAGINKYIATNGDQLSGRTTGSYVDPYGTPITLANPKAPTIAELQKYNFLPLGYTTNNPSNLTFKITITPTNCPGVGCQLPALIESSPYRDTQGNVRNDLLAFAVNAAGLDGGQSLPGNPGSYVSRGASWNLPNPSGAVGALAMRAGSLTTGYVDTLPFYKTDGSRPLTGTMQANGQNITGANAITANSMALPAGNSLTIAGVQYYGDGNNAAVRMAGSLYIQGPNGAGARSIVAQDGVFGGNSTVSGNASVGGSLSANTVNTNYAGINGDAYVAGNHTVNGVLTAHNVVNLPALAWEGWGCNSNGITTDPTGKILSCQSGVWTASGAINTVSVDSGSWQATGFAACPSNYILTGGSCDMYRGGDGRVIAPRTCAPMSNGYYCAEGNGGSCIAHAVCAQG
ncbi:hypothetical protein [Burkholderia multivorans]|uniref:hypothetical protein n=2 Tax=Burkholderia multivorans TaxID=87883 RepID=UPI001588CD0D|nr:hypothetical protein [Burkholderia multivorans]MDR9230007.1 hypothetical protein [Burkholderia multivorans]HDR9474372.1 hypothetical protein [Burkholderia multivorans]HDR9480214.1 hypothetical protein [Burkholderia multivorans]